MENNTVYGALIKAFANTKQLTLSQKFDSDKKYDMKSIIDAKYYISLDDVKKDFSQIFTKAYDLNYEYELEWARNIKHDDNARIIITNFLRTGEINDQEIQKSREEEKKQEISKKTKDETIQIYGAFLNWFAVQNNLKINKFETDKKYNLWDVDLPREETYIKFKLIAIQSKKLNELYEKYSKKFSETKNIKIYDDPNDVEKFTLLTGDQIKNYIVDLIVYSWDSTTETFTESKIANKYQDDVTKKEKYVPQPDNKKQPLPFTPSKQIPYDGVTNIEEYQYKTFKLDNVDDIYAQPQGIEYKESTILNMLKLFLQISVIISAGWISYEAINPRPKTQELLRQKEEMEKKLIDEKADVAKAEIQKDILDEQIKEEKK